MAKIHKDQAASVEDFNWLDLRRYAIFDDGDVRLWAQAILDRVDFNLWFKFGRQDLVIQQFRFIKIDPTYPVVRREHAASHAANQSAVRLLTSGQLADLNHVLFDEKKGLIKASGALPTVFPLGVDEILQTAKTSHWSRYAHLKVDLHSTDRQLKQEFADWLSAWRAVPNVASTSTKELKLLASGWARRLVLPYFDMQLHARLIGKEIPRVVFEEKLTHTIATSSGHVQQKLSRSQLDELQTDKPKIFSSTMGNAFLNASTH